MKNLKYLKDLEFTLNKELLKKERLVFQSISKLDGAIHMSPSYLQIYNNILLLKEIINNNKIEDIKTTYKNMIYAISEKKAKTFDDRTTYLNIEAIEEGKNYIKENNFIDKKLLINIQKIIRETSEEIRRSSVVIMDGKNNVVYEPPAKYEDVLNYLDELEKFINDTEEFENLNLWNTKSPLIKVAIIHYQFESIHPFSDGNGRTGRILNILYLILNKEIDNPIFSLSHYISGNKSDYYRLLDKIRKDTNKLNDFIEFFLDGMEASSQLGMLIFKKLKDFKEEIYKDLLVYFRKLEWEKFSVLYNNLMFSKETFAEAVETSKNTTNKYISILIKEGILYCINPKSKEKKYIFQKIYSFINSLD